MAALKPPAGLNPTGRALWNSITKDYELRADERRILTDACREADLIQALTKELDGSDILIIGSQGQQVLNPIVSELRQHRSTLASLLKQLKLPDATDEKKDDAGDRSASARAAAQARWSRRGSA